MDEARLRWDELVVGERYWFWSEWHGCLVTGRLKELKLNMSPDDPKFPHRAIFDGVSQAWEPGATTVVWDIRVIAKKEGDELPLLRPEDTRYDVFKSAPARDAFWRPGGKTYG